MSAATAVRGELTRLRPVLSWARRHGWKRVPDAPGIVRYFHPGTGGVVAVIPSGCLRIVTGEVTATCAITGADDILALLTAMRVLPARFSPHARNALLRHAWVCLTYADHLAAHHDGSAAEAVCRAAESATSMAEGRIRR